MWWRKKHRKRRTHDERFIRRNRADWRDDCKESAVKSEQARAIVRVAEKAEVLHEMSAELFVADYLDADALKTAFLGVWTVFLLMPETPLLPID